MYAFAQRDDMVVLDEPYYGYYLHNAMDRIAHPSQDEIMNNMEYDLDKVVASINEKASRNHVFIKGMAHHILDSNPGFLLSWENVILIRHPKKLIASFAKVIDHPTLRDIGIAKSVELFNFLHNNDKPPLVIDSDELMVDPENYLRMLCRLLDIPFEEKMLSWEKGGIPEDGLWAKHWYANVHGTTGFIVQQRKPANIPPNLGPLLAAAMPYYEILRNHILIND